MVIIIYTEWSRARIFLFLVRKIFLKKSNGEIQTAFVER